MRLFAGPPAVPARRRRLAAAPLDAPPALPPPRLKEGQWTVAQAQHRLRLDRYLRFALDGASEKSLDRASRAGCIKVNGVVLRLNTEHYVKAGDVVTLAATPAALAAVAAKAVATDWRPRILFEDDVLLVVDKPAGVASVPSRGVAANAVTSLEAFLLRRDAPAPPTTLFPLHRLDQETSGVLMLAKTARVCAPVSRLFRTRGGVEKAYIALLSGSLASPDDEGVWSDLLEVSTDGRARIFDAASAAAHPAAKTAKTAFTVLERGEKFTRIELRPVRICAPKGAVVVNTPSSPVHIPHRARGGCTSCARRLRTGGRRSLATTATAATRRSTAACRGCACTASAWRWRTRTTPRGCSASSRPSRRSWPSSRCGCGKRAGLAAWCGPARRRDGHNS